MYQCWNQDPTARPTFAEIVKLLGILQKEEPDNIPLSVSKSSDKLYGETPPNGVVHSEDDTLMSAIISHFHNTPPSTDNQPEDSADSQEGYITMNPVRETNLSSHLVIENGLNTVNTDHEYVNTPPRHTSLCEDSAKMSFSSNGLLRKHEHIQVRIESNDSDYVPMHPASPTM